MQMQQPSRRVIAEPVALPEPAPQRPDDALPRPPRAADPAPGPVPLASP